MLGGERVERQDVVFGVLQQRGDLRQPGLQLRDGLAETPACFCGVGSGEQLADDGAQRVVLVLAGVAAKVAQEVTVMPTSA